jgi:predicted DNA-binding transcriptional regulator YafY
VGQPLAAGEANTMRDVADRVERLTELVMLLLDAPATSFEDMVAGGLYPDTGESSRRAFERDKASLKDIGVPLQTTWDEAAHGTARYSIRPEDWFLDLDLDAAERLALHLAAAAVHLDADWDERALVHLGGDPGQPIPVVADLPALDALPLLYDAMRQRALVGFCYRGRERSLAPHGVFYRNGHWYLTADEAGTVKVFRIDRIEGDVEIGTADAYVLPVDADPTAALPADPLQMGDADEIVALVVIDAVLAPRIRRLPSVTVVEAHDDGGIAVEVPVRNRGAFRSWVLGLRHHAVVEGPPELRGQVVDWLQAMAGVA